MPNDRVGFPRYGLPIFDFQTFSGRLFYATLIFELNVFQFLSSDQPATNITMPATKVPKSLAEQIADLEDPAPKGTYVAVISKKYIKLSLLQISTPKNSVLLSETEETLAQKAKMRRWSMRDSTMWILGMRTTSIFTP